MQIRPMEVRDHNDVLALVNELTAFHGDVGAITYDTLVRDAAGPAPWVHVLVAEDDTGLIGYAALVPKLRFHDGERSMDLHNLHVIATMRGKGVGRALIDASAAHARKLGCAVMWIGTDPQNFNAQNMYLHFGFERCDAINPRFRLTLDKQ